MLIYMHARRGFGHVALFLLQQNNSNNFKPHQKFGKKVKRVKGLTCRKYTVI